MALNSADTAAAGVNAQQANKKEWTLRPGEEFRFEVNFKSTLKVKLESGNAEYFGAELGPTTEYTFNGENGAIFSWQGCKLTTWGECQSAYTAEETPMSSYINVHMALQQLRVQAHNEITSAEENSNDSAAPRVLIVGPEDSGKTCLAKTLLNYAIRQYECPLFVNLDPKDASISVPGTISITPITHQIDIDSGFSGYAIASSNAPPATPIVWQFGHELPTDNDVLFKLLVDNLAGALKKRLSSDKASAASGFVADTRGWTTMDSANTTKYYEIINHIVKKLRVNILLVVGSERMYSNLAKEYGSSDESSGGVRVVKLARSGGVVDRDTGFRRQTNSRIIREYFYGTQSEPFASYSTIVGFSEIGILRVGEDSKAPSSTLPLGETRKLTDTSVFEISPEESLMHSILAVTDAPLSIVQSSEHEEQDQAQKQDDVSGKECVLGKQALGFVNVTHVDMAKKRFTLLSPVPGRFPKQVLLYGQTKWMET